MYIYIDDFSYTNDIEYGNFQSSSHFLKIFGISIFYLFQDDNVYIYIYSHIYHNYHSRLTSSNGQDEIHQLLHIHIYMVDMDIMLVCMVILTNTDGFDGRG